MIIKKKDIIAVANATGNKSPGKWEVADVTGNRITAVPVGGSNTDKKVFHCSRVTECNGKDTGAVGTAEKQTSLNSKFKVAKEQKTEATTSSTKTSTTKKKNTIKLDLNALTADGSELYAKSIDSFNHDIEVMSYCLIAADKKSYKYFNLYDGSLGKNGGNSVSKRGYRIKDRKNGHKKLLNSLKKKNYTKI